MTSTKSPPADTKTGLEAGASSYLTNPVDYLNLTQAVEKMLGS
jgi:DNA-binding response OmpR family regulator